MNEGERIDFLQESWSIISHLAIIVWYVPTSFSPVCTVVGVPCLSPQCVDMCTVLLCFDSELFGGWSEGWTESLIPWHGGTSTGQSHSVALRACNRSVELLSLLPAQHTVPTFCSEHVLSKLPGHKECEGLCETQFHILWFRNFRGLPCSISALYLADHSSVRICRIALPWCPSLLCVSPAFKVFLWFSVPPFSLPRGTRPKQQQPMWQNGFGNMMVRGYMKVAHLSWRQSQAPCWGRKLPRQGLSRDQTWGRNGSKVIFCTCRNSGKLEPSTWTRLLQRQVLSSHEACHICQVPEADIQMGFVAEPESQTCWRQAPGPSITHHCPSVPSSPRFHRLFLGVCLYHSCQVLLGHIKRAPSLPAALPDKSWLVLADWDGSLMAQGHQARLVPWQPWGHQKGTALQRSS